jgi:hypothetical protein
VYCHRYRKAGVACECSCFECDSRYRHTLNRNSQKGRYTVRWRTYLPSSVS